MSETGEQHSIGIYLKVWALLFVLSFFSYMVDYLQFEGALRWSLVIAFMLLKAGAIVAVFMHFMWERLALQVALLAPIVAILVLIAIAAFEGDHINLTRLTFFAS